MRPILITGASGTLGRAFARVCTERGLAYELTSRAQLDITNADHATRALDDHEPWLVINAAGYVRVDDAENDRERCHLENAIGPEHLARACARANIPLVAFSSDLVFDGAQEQPYEENDRPSPLCVYGRSKYEAEQRVLTAHARSLVVRTSAFFGPWDEHNFVTSTLSQLASGRTVRAACDMTVSPTYVPDLVHTVLDLAIDGEVGIWHLANRGATSWSDLGRSAARLHGLPEEHVLPVPMRLLAMVAPRPRFSALGSARGALLPRLDDALGRFQGARI